MLLSYSINGSGVPLVFLHGYLENKELWKDFSASFIKNQVTCIDLPGCGLSPVQPEQSIESMALSVYNTLTEMKIQNAFFVAHSMGGYVALALADMHPEIFKGLVLLHSHPFADNDEKKKARMQEVEIVKAGKKSLLLQTFIPKLYAPSFNDEKYFSLSRKLAESMSEEGMIACLRAMANRKDKTQLINSVNFPVLWIYGKYDQLFNYEMAEKFNLTNPNVKKYLMSSSGHMSMMEQKDEVLSLIKAFINS
ncbi:MAG TPA: alpha/beta hydrolase [Bacteroidales bacterium]|nr:alpha/beta hydrolase [Bacteroidales bacterium]